MNDDEFQVSVELSFCDALDAQMENEFIGKLVAKYAELMKVSNVNDVVHKSHFWKIAKGNSRF